MRIDYIEFKNFASYGNQKQRIDFVKDGSELFLTLGKNGDGKTTIANAIIYALYGKVEGVKLADLPNRINKELLVKIGLQCGTMFIEIERGIAPSRFNVLINGVELINQTPIGKISRSNPITYTKGYDDIRQLFANENHAKSKGFKPGYFSFNVDGGRCEKCQGEGQITISMQFMADVHLTCDECNGNLSLIHI